MGLRPPGTYHTEPYFMSPNTDRETDESEALNFSCR